MMNTVCLLLVFSVAVLPAVMSSNMAHEQRLDQDQEMGRELRSNQRQNKGSEDESGVLGAIGALERRVIAQEQTIRQMQRDAKRRDMRDLRRDMRFEEAIDQINRTRLGASMPVAFSTYLEYPWSGMHADQIIRFGGVLLNEGGAYDVDSGIFIVPMDGVYMFSFFIGDRNEHQLYAKLTVNGIEKSSAVVETVQKYDDGQGGNVVILRLNKGEKVAIRHKEGGYIESHSTNRISTFSGYMLYY